MNILSTANNIINNRSEESDRKYGPIDEGMERAAQVASITRGRTLDAHDMFAAMIGLKLSRQGYAFKEDNLLDMVAYAGAWQNYIAKNPMPVQLHPKLEIFKRLKDEGQINIARGVETKELLNTQIVIKPYDRWYSFDGRKYRVKYLKQELLWYLKGDKYDLSILEHASMWKTLVNEDRTINSNYGQYIFKDGNFIRCANTLLEDKNSRRAVIVILTNDCLNSETKDYCCTQSIVFYIRNSMLHMTVNMRSNDLIFGLANDVPAFSFIHEMMMVYLRDTAYSDLVLGDYTHCSVSSHIYSTHYDMLDTILSKNSEIPIECPKIKCLHEVNSLLENKYDNQYDFTKWLLS